VAKGDHLIVRRGWYTHHAIDLGDGYVVQYGRGLSDGVTASVHVTSDKRFSKGRQIEVYSSATSFDADEIALRALNCVGEHEYHILWNNCEHFVNWCRTGKRESSQVDWLIENASDVVAKVVVSVVTTGAAKLAVKASAKLSSKAASRAATTPWLIAADAAQLIAESTASALGRDKNEAKRTGQAVGVGASAGIGALAAGPVGAAVAVGIWAMGEVVGNALSSRER
jgi:hypothetical protein